MCTVSNGQSTSGLKKKPKCIATVQTTEQGNLPAHPSGWSIVRKIQCAGEKDIISTLCRYKNVEIMRSMQRPYTYKRIDSAPI